MHNVIIYSFLIWMVFETNSLIARTIVISKFVLRFKIFRSRQILFLNFPVSHLIVEVESNSKAPNIQ